MWVTMVVLLLSYSEAISFAKEHKQAETTNDQQNESKSAHIKPSGFSFGIMIAPSDAFAIDATETYFEICKNLGARYLKIGILWDLVEPDDGRFIWISDMKKDRARARRPRDFGPARGGRNFDYDYIAALSQKYNISVIPTFLRSRMPERETNSGKYAAFVYAFVKRYKKSMNIDYIEFQNEPNSGNDGSGNGRHWKGTAESLVRVNNAAYDKIKSAYPDIRIGTAGFISGSKTMINKYTAKFYEEYFKSKPKFDVFMLHEYPKNMNYTQGTKEGDLASQFHIFKTYRKMLNSYGYADKPILVSEGYEDKPFRKYTKLSMDWMDEEEASVLFVESYVFTMMNSEKQNIIGKVISGVRTGINQNIGLVDAVSGRKRAQYYVIKEMISLLKRYPIYSKHIAGEINSDAFWIEEFMNKNGKKLWIAFNPIIYNTDDELLPTIVNKTMKYPQRVRLNVGKASEVQILRISSGSVNIENQRAVKGEIIFNLEKSPLFITESLFN